MAEQKKDLTNLMDYAKAMQESGQAAPVPEGSVMEEQKIEKVDDFESLEDYSKSHPTAEPPPEPAFDAAPAAPPEPPPQSPPSSLPSVEAQAQDGGMPGESAFVTTPDPAEAAASQDAADFPVTDSAPAADAIAGLDAAGAIPGLDASAGADAMPPLPDGVPPAGAPTGAGTHTLGAPVSGPSPAGETNTFGPGGEDLSALQVKDSGSELLAPPPDLGGAAPELAAPMPELAPPTPSEDLSVLAPPPAPPEALAAPQPAAPRPEGTQTRLNREGGAHSFVAPPGSELAQSHGLPDGAPAADLREPLRPANKPAAAPRKPMERVRHYSENFTPGNKTAVPAAFPFSLLITGMLAPEEKERLTDILSRENMGIRELDLEPQFEAGKILIPRISEYAGVMLVSALRSAQVKMRLGPSDQVYATADTQDGAEEELDSGEHEVETYTSERLHPAEDLPITADSFLPGQIRHAVVDIVTASAALKTMVVQAEHSPEYQMLVEALQRELKYKAFRKGANAIVGFSVQLVQLHLPMHYRVMVTGSAVKAPGGMA